MDYKTFKKQMMPDLDRQMADIGYVREGTSMPIYWTCPHVDQRLAWVVAIGFSGLGNSLFSVGVTPYWIPCQHADDPFPRSVVYHGSLAPAACGPDAYHTWFTRKARHTDLEQTQKCFAEVIEALLGPGHDWMQTFSTPEKLYAHYPTGRLAADLEKYAQAVKLYRSQYQLDIHSALYYMKASHSTPQEGQRDWARQRDERTLREYRDACLNAGMDASACNHEIWTAEREKLIEEEEDFRVEYENDRRQRGFKVKMDYCQRRIAELDGLISA